MSSYERSDLPVIGRDISWDEINGRSIKGFLRAVHFTRFAKRNQVRHDDFVKVQRVNRLTAPVTIASLMATLMLSLITSPGLG